MYKTLKIFTDGGSRGNPGPSASGIYITDEQNTCVASFGIRLGITTNNVAEYSAVIHALEWVYNKKDNINKDTHIHFFMDSKLVCSQLSGIWKIKDKNMQKLAMEVREKMLQIPGHFTFTHIPREQNKEADRMVNHALDNRT